MESSVLLGRPDYCFFRLRRPAEKRQTAKRGAKERQDDDSVRRGKTRRVRRGARLFEVLVPVRGGCLGCPLPSLPLDVWMDHVLGPFSQHAASSWRVCAGGAQSLDHGSPEGREPTSSGTALSCGRLLGDQTRARSLSVALPVSQRGIARPVLEGRPICATGDDHRHLNIRWTLRPPSEGTSVKTGPGQVGNQNQTGEKPLRWDAAG